MDLSFIATEVSKESLKEQCKKNLDTSFSKKTDNKLDDFNIDYKLLDIEESIEIAREEALNFVETLNQAFDDIWKDVEKPVVFTKDKIKTVDFDTIGFLKNLKEHTFYTPDGKTFTAKIDEVIDFDRTITMPYARFEGRSVNSAGFLRDKDYFAKEYLEKYPETLSEYNKKLIEVGKSPVVDEVWIRYNPLHKHFMGEKLEHHHINNTDKAAYIPQSLHRGRINKDIMHVDNTSLISETYSLIRQNLGE